MPRSESSVEAADFSVLPLYNTSFTLYRCSPLHLPRKTTEDDFRNSLSQHTRRFADHLQREARLGLSVLGALDDTDALARAGQLKQTTWTWEGPNPDAHDALEGPDGFGLTEGLRVVVEFERATYAALFLRRRDQEVIERDNEDDAEHQRLRLPLLFFRMPASLRGTLMSYIAAQFDARADPISLPGSRLAGALEDYLATIAPDLQRDATEANDSDSDAESRSPALKDVQLTLSFPNPALRSLDVAIPGKDVAHFIKLGAQTAKDKDQPNGARRNGGAVSGTRTGPRAESKEDSLASGPFTSALAAYLHVHLALDTAHADVRLARVACGTWAIAAEGRVKLFAPKSSDREVAREIVRGLLRRLMDTEGREGRDGDEDVDMG